MVHRRRDMRRPTLVATAIRDAYHLSTLGGIRTQEICVTWNCTARLCAAPAIVPISCPASIDALRVHRCPHSVMGKYAPRGHLCALRQRPQRFRSGPEPVPRDLHPEGFASRPEGLARHAMVTRHLVHVRRRYRPASQRGL
jgi:hypothetical protein